MRQPILKIMIVMFVSIFVGDNLQAEGLTAPGKGILSLSRHLEIFEDKNGHLGVLELPKDRSHWVGHGRDAALMFGFSRSTFWVRFALDHAGDEKQQIVIESLDPSSDFIEIFVFDKRGRLLANVKSGDQTESFSINAKNIRNRYPAFLVELTEPVDIYVSLKGRSPLKFDLQLANPDNFYDRRLHDFGLNLMVLGIGIFLFFYNLFLYIQVRETVYIPYLLTVVSVQMCILASNGFCRVLFPDNTYLPNTGLCIFTYVSIIGGSWVNIVYLDLKKYTRPFYWIAVASIIVCFPLMVAAQMELDLGGQGAILLAMSLPAVGITQGIVVALKGYRPAVYFTMAWIFLEAGSISKAMEVIGIIDNVYIGEWALPIGSLLEVMTLSLAFGYKLKHRQEESNREIHKLNEDLTARNVEINTVNEKLKTFNLQLETLVVQKTADIRSLLDSMEDAVVSVYRDGHSLKIHGEHSKYLLKMLDEDEVSNQDMRVKILSKFDLSSDARDSICQIFYACLNCRLE